MSDNMDKKLREKIKIRQEAHKNMEHVRKFSTEQLQAKIEEPDMKLFLIYPVGKSKVQHQNKKHYQQEGIWQNFMNRSVRNSSIGYSSTCTKSTVISVIMPPPHFYRKYAPPFSEGSFLKILWWEMPG